MLFTLTPAAGVRVHASRTGAIMVRLETGEVRRCGEKSVDGWCRVAHTAPRKSLTLGRRWAAGECDGRHACRHHGGACPALVERRRAHQARCAKRTAALEARTLLAAAARASHHEWVRAQDARARAAYLRYRSKCRDALAGAPCQNGTPFYERVDYECAIYVWTTYGGLQVPWLSHAERNKLAHALNGNIAWSDVMSMSVSWSLGSLRKQKASPTPQVSQPPKVVFAANSDSAASGNTFATYRSLISLDPEVASLVQELREIEELDAAEAAEAAAAPPRQPTRMTFRDIRAAMREKYKLVAKGKKKAVEVHTDVRPSATLTTALRDSNIPPADVLYDAIYGSDSAKTLIKELGPDGLVEPVEDEEVRALSLARAALTARKMGTSLALEGEEKDTYSMAVAMPASLLPDAFAASAVAKEFDSRVAAFVPSAGPSRRTTTTATSRVRHALWQLTHNGVRPDLQRPPPKSVLRARDSSMADIEVNPGPAFPGFFAPLLAAANFGANYLRIWVGSDMYLKVKLKQDKAKLQPAAPSGPAAAGSLAHLVDGWSLQPPSKRMISVRNIVAGATNACPQCPAGRKKRRLRPSVLVTLPLNLVVGEVVASDIYFRLMVELCRDHGDDPRLVLHHMARNPNWEFEFQTVLQQYVGLRRRSIEDFRCTDTTHDQLAIAKWAFKLPSLSKNRPRELHGTTVAGLGFNQPNCPLCRPNSPTYGVDPREHADPMLPPQLKSLTVFLAALQDPLVGLALVGRALFIVLTGTIAPDISMWEDEWCVVFVHDDKQPPENAQGQRLFPINRFFLVNMIWTLRMAMPVAYGDMAFAVTFDAYFHHWTPEVASLPRGTYTVTTSACDQERGALIDPATDEWLIHNGPAVIARMHHRPKAAFLYPAHFVPSNVVRLTGQSATGASTVDSLVPIMDEALPCPLTIVSLDHPGRSVRVTAGTNLGMAAGNSLLDGPMQDNAGAWLTITRMLTAPWQTDHEGMVFYVSREDLPVAERFRPQCGCFQCRVAMWYGPIFIVLTGTHGDRVPPRALARQLTKWGLDVYLVSVYSEATGLEMLSKLQEGQVMSLTPLAGIACAVTNAIPYTTIGPAETNATIPWSLSPPPSQLRSFVWRQGPLLDPLLTKLSGHQATLPRIAAYKGVLNLPRSADGIDFLQTSSNKKRSGELWALGSSGHTAPPGAPLVQPGDHYSQFERVQTVLTHGGAGTVQTAAAAGAQVVVVDPVFDRNYLDNMNAGADVWTGADPNKVILLLLGVDYLPFLLAFRGGIRLGFDAIRWWAALYGTSDIITVSWLLYHSYHSMILVPGSIGDSIAATLINAVAGRTTAILGTLVFAVWGTLIYSRLGLTPWGAVMNLVRMSRRLSRRVLAATLLSYGCYTAALIAFFVEGWLVPYLWVVREAWREPKGYVRFHWIETVGLPLHMSLECLDGSVIQGTDVGREQEHRYALRQMEDGPHCGKVFLRLPTLFRPETLLLAPTGVYGYNFISNNCIVIVMRALNGHYTLVGPALGLIAVASALAIVAGMAGVAIVLGVAFTLFVVGMIVPDFSVDLGLILALLTSRFRALEALETLRPAPSILAQALRAGVLLTNIAGLTEEERDIVAAVTAADAEIAEACATGEVLAVKEVMDRLRATQPWLEGAVSAIGTLFGLLNRSSRSELVDALSDMAPQALFVLRYIHVTERLMHLVSDGNASLIEFIDMRNFIRDAAEGVTPAEAMTSVTQSETIIEILQWLLEHELLVLDMLASLDWKIRLHSPSSVIESLAGCYEDNPVWGQVPEGFDPTFYVCEEDEAGSRQLLTYYFFLMRDVDPRVLHTAIDRELGTELTTDELHALGGLAAVAKKFGADDVRAVTEAVLSLKDVLHGPTAPVQSADAEANADVTAYFAATKDVRWLLQKFFDGWWYARSWLHRQEPAPSILAWADGVFNLLETFVRMVTTAMYRLLTAWMGSTTVMGMTPVSAYNAVVHGITLLVQMLDPRHRATPKPVWALLWKRARANITKGEALLFGLAESSYTAPGSYAEWVDQMANLLTTDEVDVSILSRAPPERAVFYPNAAVGLVPEYNDLPITGGAVFHEMAVARKVFEQHRERGGKLTIDGAWLATPEAVQMSIERYTVPRPEVSFAVQGAISDAADALYDHYKHLYERPLPLTVSNVAHLSKWKYAAGLPFMPAIKKRAALRHSPWFQAIQVAAERILKSGKMPAVGLHAFPKAQVVEVQRLLDNPAKLRTVTAGDRVTATAFNTLMMERNKRVGKVTDGLLNMMRRSEGGINALRPHIERFPYKFSGDGRAFDSTVCKEVATVGSVRLYERGLSEFGVYNTKAATSVVKAYYEALTAGLIVNLMDGTTIFKTGGGGTGSAATTPDNRDWTRIVFVAGWALTTGMQPKTFFDHFTFTNASDDVFFSCSEFAKEKLPEMLDTLRAEFGVDFTVNPEETMNNILHLTIVPEEEVDRSMYERLGLEVPPTPLRHSPNRLLLMRSAFRSDRARANEMVMAEHVAERSCGYQLLTAHNVHEYDMVTQDLVDANLQYAKAYFKNAEAVIERGPDGLIKDGCVVILDDMPSRTVKYWANRAHRRWPGRSVDQFVAEYQRTGRRTLAQRRGKSYAQVFRLWVQPPPEGTATKAHRRWTVYSRAGQALGPVSDIVRLGIIKMDQLWREVPNALKSSVPEKARIGLNAPLNTHEYILEQYIWRREFLRTNTVPSFERMSALIRESPYAAATDLISFMALLGQSTVLSDLVTATRTNKAVRTRHTWIVSNDAIMGRTLAFVVWYTMIDVAIARLEKLPVFGVFVIAMFATYRWVEIAYSIQSLLFWIGTGTASLIISNVMPRDRYVLQKIIAAILTTATPWFVTDYLVGSFVAASWLGKLIEAQTLIPLALLAANNELAASVTRKPDSTWAAFVRSLGTPDRVRFVVGGTGTGKSTALVRELLDAGYTQIIVSCPTNRLVTGYVNDFVPENAIERVSVATQRDQLFDKPVVVMTHAQTWRRIGQFGSRQVALLLDEVHDCSGDLLAAYAMGKGVANRTICLTATPAGLFVDTLLATVEKWFEPGQPRFKKQGPFAVPDITRALQRVRAEGHDLNNTMVYHPSVRKLDLFATAFESLGARVRFATREIEPENITAAVLCTGVVLAGANIRPAPTTLVFEPTKLVPELLDTFQTSSNGMVRADMQSVTRLVTLVPAPLSPEELTQLTGRIGREREGTSYVLGHLPEGGTLVPRLSLFGVSQLAEWDVRCVFDGLQGSRYMARSRGQTPLWGLVPERTNALALTAPLSMGAFSVALLAITNDFATMSAALADPTGPLYSEYIDAARSLGLQMVDQVTIPSTLQVALTAITVNYVYIWDGARRRGGFPIFINDTIRYVTWSSYAPAYVGADIAPSQRAVRRPDTNRIEGADPGLGPACDRHGGEQYFEAVHSACRERIGYTILQPARLDSSCCVPTSHKSSSDVCIGEYQSYWVVVSLSTQKHGVSFVSKYHSPDQHEALPVDTVCGHAHFLTRADHFHCHLAPGTGGVGFVIPAHRRVTNLRGHVMYNHRHAHHYRPQWKGPLPHWEPFLE